MTIPPEVVRTLASSTVFVKASSLVNRDFAGMIANSNEVCSVNRGERGEPFGMLRGQCTLREWIGQPRLLIIA